LAELREGKSEEPRRRRRGKERGLPKSIGGREIR